MGSRIGGESTRRGFFQLGTAFVAGLLDGCGEASSHAGAPRGGASNAGGLPSAGGSSSGGAGAGSSAGEAVGGGVLPAGGRGSGGSISNGATVTSDAAGESSAARTAASTAVVRKRRALRVTAVPPVDRRAPHRADRRVQFLARTLAETARSESLPLPA